MTKSLHLITESSVSSFFISMNLRTSFCFIKLKVRNTLHVQTTMSSDSFLTSFLTLFEPYKRKLNSHVRALTGTYNLILLCISSVF